MLKIEGVSHVTYDSNTLYKIIYINKIINIILIIIKVYIFMCHKCHKYDLHGQNGMVPEEAIRLLLISVASNSTTR